MITRIVKMTFMPERIDDFKKIFDENKNAIRNFKGCTHLDLLQDVNNPAIFFTYSYWNSENDLLTYRESELFNKVWAKTNILFAEKAEAWSTSLIHRLN